jgi:hypothetical protein
LESAPVQKTEIQRESNFVLPKPQNGNKPENKNTDAVVQRENFTKPSGSNSFKSSSKQTTGFGQLPHGGFGNNNFAKNSGSLPSGESYFERNQPLNTVQREMNDAGSAAQNSTPISPVINTEKILEEELNEHQPEATARQLEILADRLVPRIKRIIRAEMERSIFR